MIRIRFHGRGGHGVKTASRVLGTAAFLSGYEAQDSPVYGAERRGAPVTAFTRIDQASILERGIIESPDLIVVGDETLLEDPTAGVLSHQETASAVFVNTGKDIDEVRDRYEIHPPITSLDVTSLTIEKIGKASALSAALAAVTARMSGIISQEKLIEAVQQELADLDLDDDAIERNTELARSAFVSVSPVKISTAPRVSDDLIHSVGYDGPLRGSPSVLAPGNAELRKTRSWRTVRPDIDLERCTRCGLCFVSCPDGAIALDDEGYPVIDYDHCKGCLICIQRCPIHIISGEKEVRAW